LLKCPDMLCKINYMRILLFFSIACGTGDLRLTGGSFANQGRVEVCRDGAWGTVCDDAWTAIDARVACIQLGFSRNSKSNIAEHY